MLWFHLFFWSVFYTVLKKNFTLSALWRVETHGHLEVDARFGREQSWEVGSMSWVWTHRYRVGETQHVIGGEAGQCPPNNSTEVGLLLVISVFIIFFNQNSARGLTKASPGLGSFLFIFLFIIVIRYFSAFLDQIAINNTASLPNLHVFMHFHEQLV